MIRFLNYKFNRFLLLIYNRIIIKMNQKNSKTINEKGKIGKGFGFGDAMFNIKDLVSDYSQFSGNS